MRTSRIGPVSKNPGITWCGLTTCWRARAAAGALRFRAHSRWFLSDRSDLLASHPPVRAPRSKTVRKMLHLKDSSPNLDWASTPSYRTRYNEMPMVRAWLGFCSGVLRGFHVQVYTRCKTNNSLELIKPTHPFFRRSSGGCRQSFYRESLGGCKLII